MTNGINGINFIDYLKANEGWLSSANNGKHETNGDISNEEVNEFIFNHINKDGDDFISSKEFDTWYSGNQSAIKKFLNERNLDYYDAKQDVYESMQTAVKGYKLNKDVSFSLQRTLIQIEGDSTSSYQERLEAFKSLYNDDKKDFVRTLEEANKNSTDNSVTRIIKLAIKEIKETAKTADKDVQACKDAIKSFANIFTFIEKAGKDIGYNVTQNGNKELYNLAKMAYDSIEKMYGVNDSNGNPVYDKGKRVYMDINGAFPMRDEKGKLIYDKDNQLKYESNGAVTYGSIRDLLNKNPGKYTRYLNSNFVETQMDP